MKDKKLGTNWFPENVSKIQHTGKLVLALTLSLTYLIITAHRK